MARMTSVQKIPRFLNRYIRCTLIYGEDKKQRLVIKILLSIVKHRHPSYTPIPNNIKLLTVLLIGIDL